jgi:hypothetical protein
MTNRSSKYTKFADHSWQAGYRIGVSGSEYFVPLGIIDRMLFVEGFAFGRKLVEDLKAKRTTRKRRGARA